jgi:hypothetical protein
MKVNDVAMEVQRAVKTAKRSGLTEDEALKRADAILCSYGVSKIMAGDELDTALRWTFRTCRAR